jgi:predicted permease
MSLNILIPILILFLLVGIGYLLVKLFKWLRKDKDKLEKNKMDTDY